MGALKLPGGRMKTNKLVLTNWSALVRKYGNRTKSVQAAVNRLIAADKKRGVRTKLVKLDELEPALGGENLAAVAGQRAAKRAVEKAVAKYEPEYLLLLGAGDVIPFQHVKNPMNTNADPDDDDEDVDVPSDLPYACPGDYTDDPLNLLGATRVVGRLPDLVAASTPTYLLEVLRIAAAATSRPYSDYETVFGLSTYSWRASTRLTMDRLGAKKAPLHVSPEEGPNWSKKVLSGRVHFINCHGGDRAPRFFGEKGKRQPTAHEARKLDGRIVEGSIVASECCYGAQLYDPRRPFATEREVPNICAVYLREGAYGFFGSTNIAYGPSEGNGQADLICRFFVEGVQAGASLGRATLEARQRFAAQFTHLDPADLKTLLQFCLLGDPSIHPVKSVPHALSKSPALRKTLTLAESKAGSRALRRERAERTGENLRATLGAVEPLEKAEIPRRVMSLLRAIAKETGIEAGSVNAYRIVQGGHTKRDRRVFTLTGSLESAVPDETPLPRQVVSLIATLDEGKLLHLRRVHSR